MTAPTSNAYWDAVLPWVGADSLFGRTTVGPIGQQEDWARPIMEAVWVQAARARYEYVARWAWTVTAPDTVAFVAEHLGPAAIDPLAGTGWWAHLLTGLGVDVDASDLHPPGGGDLDHWHSASEPHYPVRGADGVTAVTERGAGRSLLLAWPPHSNPIGADILRAYPGNRVVYMGEIGGMCGDENLFTIMEAEWAGVAYASPVQWSGIHDEIYVLDRKL